QRQHAALRAGSTVADPGNRHTLCPCPVGNFRRELQVNRDVHLDHLAVVVQRSGAPANIGNRDKPVHPYAMWTNDEDDVRPRFCEVTAHLEHRLTGGQPTLGVFTQVRNYRKSVRRDRTGYQWHRGSFPCSSTPAYWGSIDDS